jgi:predicted nuclease with TOPRIM domain
MPVPTPENLQSIQIPMSIWGPIFTAIGGLGTGAMFVLKKISAQKAEAARTGVETDVVSHLQLQRDDAIKNSKESSQAKENAEQSLLEARAKMEQMQDQIDSLRSRLALMNQLVGRLTAALDLTKQQLTTIIKSNDASKIQLANDTLRTINNSAIVNLPPTPSNV